ncbi:MAG: hypothetical protein V4662_07775 [Verrucomicrobiota bacterium]
MKKSEKLLLGAFAVLFLVIIGGGAMAMGIKQYLAIREENETLRDRVIEMNEAIAQGAEWQRRHDWLEERVPGYTSRQEASAKLLEVIQREADKLSLTLVGKEFLEPVKTMGPDGLPLEEEGGYFDQAAVKITLTKVKEQPFFAWLHSMQTPDSFLGITRLQITPAGEGKTINVEAEITQFYREKASAKLSKAGTP